MTVFHASYFAHELSRRYSLNDSGKLAHALADAQVDLNPHQLDAALFAFKSPLAKGCILADEVGLGKTIEAGLVIAQKWAEKKRRILIICPANLRKQWAMEMAEKFYLPSVILEASHFKKKKNEPIKEPFRDSALLICSYQFAARYAEQIMIAHWDLAVIDESHRLRNVYKSDNKIAKAIKNALRNTPKIMLTATPLQNSLMELYGLVSIIDDYAFGDEKSFKFQYVRGIGNDSYGELKERLKPLCHRTLRRQVLEYIRYTNRIPLTEDFYPTSDEIALYDMVTEYLQRETLYALPNSQRQLITLILRKLLASSTSAIAGALESLANRLKRELTEEISDDAIEEVQADIDEFPSDAEEWGEDGHEENLSDSDIESIKAEIAELERFRDLAIGITENAKGLALLKALKHGFEKAREIGAAEKAIVFTESRKTQNYLVELLSANGYSEKLVLFNGTNSDSQSKKLYADWLEKNQGTDKVSGSKSADMRSALVDHFRNSAQIMIATEAGAEGINLQFCSMLVNYDLPWNPQRIEQRIGRCHRYGQKHDVVVINFINRSNAADQRVFELLDQKFQLFSGVFGASDEVLGAIDSGIDFEKRIAQIYQTCRTSAEIEFEFNRLQSEMENQITETMSDTRQKLLENFDAEVHDRLKVSLNESRDYLNRFDSMLWKLTCYGLDGKADFDNENLRFVLRESPVPDIPDGTYALSREVQDTHRYRIGHPLAQMLISKFATHGISPRLVQFDYTNWKQTASALEPLCGRSGSLSLSLLSVSGADEQDHLIFAAVLDSGEVIPSETCRRLFDLTGREMGKADCLDTHALLVQFEEQRAAILGALAKQQANWFEEEMAKLDYWAEDKRKGLKGDLKEFDEAIAELKKEARQVTSLPDKVAIQKKLRDLDSNRDHAWRAYDDAAKEIERQKDALLDSVEARLAQTTEEKTIFSIRWSVI